jgi:hypothetical protein
LEQVELSALKARMEFLTQAPDVVRSDTAHPPYALEPGFKAAHASFLSAIAQFASEMELSLRKFSQT